MVQEALTGAEERGAEVELISLAKKKIAFCDGCLSCRTNEGCHIKDDMQDVYAKVLEADGIIFGTPVYFWSVSAQAKAVIDRCLVFYQRYNLRDKAAGVVVATERAGGVGAFTVFTSFFTIQRMVPVGCTIGFGGVEKGGVKDDKVGMAEAKALGRAMVKRIQSLNIKAR
jgi:multimeric flavodoxin WrbA